MRQDIARECLRLTLLAGLLFPLPFPRSVCGQDFGPARSGGQTPVVTPASPATSPNATGAPATPPATPPAPGDSPPPATVGTPSPPATPAAPTAEPSVVPVTGEQLDLTRIEELRARVEASTELDEATKVQVRTFIQKAQEDLKQVQRLEAEQAKATADLQKVSDEKERLKTEMAQQRTALVIRPSLYSSVEDLERTLSEKQQALAARQAELSALTTSLGQRAERRTKLREIISTTSQKVANVNQSLQDLSVSTEPPLVVEAKRAALFAEKRRLERELPAAQAELSLYDAQDAAGLLQLNEELLKAKISTLRDQVSEWTSTLSQRRKEDAVGRLKDAEKGVESAPELLTPVYKDMVEFAQAEVEIRQKRQNLLDKLTEIQRDRDKLDSALEQSRQREARAGKSPAFGIRLRQERRLLGDVPKMYREKRSRLQDLEQAQLDYLNWRDRDESLVPVEQYMVEVDRQIEQERLDEEELTAVRSEAKQVLKQREEYADATVKAYDDYIDTLVTLDLEQAGLIEANQTFARYIDERVLWIRSRPALTLNSMISDTEGLQFLVSPSLWNTITSFYVNDFWSFPYWYVVSGLIWSGLLASSRWLRALMSKLGQRASNRLNTSMTPTFRGLLVTVALSLALPLPFWLAGWRAWQSPLNGDMILSLGIRLVYLGSGLFCLQLARQLCRTGGIGEVHFGWPARVCRMVSNQVRKQLLLGGPLAIVIILLWLREDRENVDALGRMLMIALALLVAATFNRLNARSTGIFREWLSQNPGSWLDRLSSLWQLIAVAVPLSLAVLTFIGYDYTAIKLSSKLALSYLLVGTLLVLRSLLFRSLSFRQRRLAIEHARQRRAAAAAAAESTLYPGHGAAKAEASGGLSQAMPAASAESVAELTEVSAQTRRLLQTTLIVVGVVGIWLIWVDVLPALNYFNRWTFPGTQISYTSLGVSIIATALTFTAARNIPGLLEILILQRLPLDRSAKYAIGAISRYCILLIGLLVVSDALSIGWEHVQWLAAALTFGLGFGLQEIFANFVSGIILLFEQPIRVGDVVTVDGVSGTVSRIRARATTITDWDRKEYIVPNREFITGKLLNWTLSDTVNRIVITVGTSYSSDPAQVCSVVLTAIQAQPHILKDPPPSVVFDGFGDSSLNFTVRAFLPDLEHRLITIDSMHKAIFEALDKAGIEIPFPQRDLHIRSGISEEFLKALASEKKEVDDAESNGHERSTSIGPSRSS